VSDVTESLAVFGVMGPRSRNLLQSLTEADLGDEAFPFSTSQILDLAGVTLRATRITYVGELGWELYVPTEHATSVYRELVAAGSAVDAKPAGYYAINSLRLDMGYRAFAADLTPDYTPVEAGLTFTCDLRSNNDFIGRDAVERARETGVRRRLVSVTLHDSDVMLWGGELLRRDGAAVGQVTSAAWSETLGAAVGLAYVWRPDGNVVTSDDMSGEGFTVNVGGLMCEVSVSPRAPRSMSAEARGTS
jgi:4-methylaminobutanoate oxidase (formaldehyde-forming)